MEDWNALHVPSAVEFWAVLALAIALGVVVIGALMTAGQQVPENSDERISGDW